MRLDSTTQTVLDSLADGALIVAEDGQIVFANPASSELFGWSQRELVGRCVDELVPALVRRDDDDRCHEHTPRPRRRRMGQTTGEIAALTKDGRSIAVDLNLTSMEVQGRPVTLVCARDVSAQRELADDLRRQREILERIFRTTHIMIVYLNRDLDFVRVNRAYADAAGHRDPSVFVGKNHFDLYPHEENERLFRAVIETGEPFSITAKPFEHPDQIERGTTYWDWSLNPTFDEQGEVDGLVFCLLDVTDHVRAVAARQQSEEQFRGLLEALPAGVAVARVDRLLYVNRVFAELVGRRGEELIGLELGRVLDVSALLSHGAGRPQRAMLRNASGHEIPVELFCEVVRFDGKGAELYVAHDLRERERLQAEITRRSKLEAIGRLAGGIAHDFNNVLTIVKTNAFLGLMDLEEGHVVRGYLASIKGASDHAAGITRQLLALARRDSDEGRIVDVGLCMAEFLELLPPLLGSDIELSTEISGDSISCRIDPIWLEQVLLNLCLNARDAMSAGGTLTVSSRVVELNEAQGAALGLPEGQYCRIEVSDTGHGMDERTRTRAFEPFFTTRGAEGGSGLGLATSHGIITRLGGAITLDSELGRGTTMGVLLPKAQDPLEWEAASMPSDHAVVGNGETVLLVEDDTEVRSSTRSVLELYGYDVIDTDGLEGARTICERSPQQIDLVLTDVVLRSGGGREVSEVVAEHRPATPVLFMSGCTADVLGERGIEPNEQRLIRKPFSPIELARRVREALIEAHAD